MEQVFPFTIKHVMTNGNVMLWPAVNVKQVSSIDMTNDPYQGVEGAPERVEFDRANGEFGSIDTGVCYIMNSQGKTVQTVTLPMPK